jgi:ribosomal protein S15P/S13E
MLERLEGRLKEMQERRRRLIKYLYKKEGKLDEFEEGYQQSINKKNSIIKKFPSL